MDFKQFYKTINFDIDNEIRTVFQATQGDTKSRGLLVDLIVGGVKTPVTTEEMTFFALKPDGTRVMTVGVKEGTGFRIDFTNQTFSVAGTLLCALVLYGTNGEKIADKKFKMTVDSSLEDGAIISEDERGILDRAFELAEDIVPRMEALATLGERLDWTDAQLAETGNRIDNIIATPIDLPEIYVDEIHDARQGKGSLGANITEVKANLAEKEKRLNSVENANSKEVIRIKNYLNNFNNIHPKILNFPIAWNGFKYWMAYTPYPAGTTDAENPCIAVSNDMLTWTIPTGLVNPLDFGTTDDYNSDTHLIYRADLNRMEIWWRRRDSVNAKWLIYRRTSTDGFTWTSRELIFTNTSLTDTMSPALIFEDGKYKLWYVRNHQVQYRESMGDTVSNWTAEQTIAIDWLGSGIRPWHLDVVRTDLGYEMLVSCRAGLTATVNDLYYVLQKTDGTTTTPKLSIKRSTNPRAFDNGSIYRASFVKIGDVYYVFYSAIDKAMQFWMALTTGTTLVGLNGTEYLKNGERVLTLTDAGEVEVSDIENYDSICVKGTTKTTITLIRGGYTGQKINVYLGDTNNTLSCQINYRGVYLETPFLRPYIIDRNISGSQAVELVCVNGTAWSWTVCGYAPPPPAAIVKNIYRTIANEILTNFDITNYDAIEIIGTGVVINSFIGGYEGKVLHIFASNVAQSATITYSGSLKVSSGDNVIIGRDKMGVTAIKRHPTMNEWVLF